MGVRKPTIHRPIFICFTPFQRTVNSPIIIPPRINPSGLVGDSRRTQRPDSQTMVFSTEDDYTLLLRSPDLYCPGSLRIYLRIFTYTHHVSSQTKREKRMDLFILPRGINLLLQQHHLLGLPELPCFYCIKIKPC